MEKRIIYADHAATTAVSEEVLQAMLPYFTQNFGNPSSIYRIGRENERAVLDARSRIAACLGAEPKEIFFTAGGSESDNWAIKGIADKLAAKGKKHIITTVFEHHAVLHTCEFLEKHGFEVTYLPVSPEGLIDPQQVADAIREDTALVTIMYANNEIGTVQPIPEIGKICREKQVLFHTDAVQAAGHLYVNVKEQNIDMLSLSAHKFHGPKGIGVLYAKRGIVLDNVINGGAQERGKRAGTENIPAIMGMAAALEEAFANLDKNNEKLIRLRDRLIEGLDKIPYGELNGDRKNRLPGNVNFCFEGIEGESLLLLLDDKGICASSGSACTSGSLDPSHVLLAIGRPHEVAHGSLRLSINEETTEEDIDYMIEAVTDVVTYLRNMSPFWRDLTTGKRTHVFAE